MILPEPYLPSDLPGLVRQLSALWRALQVALVKVDSGTYTPTLTNVANVTASLAQQCQWSRVGDTVTVGGTLTLAPAVAGTLTEVGISLPVASNLTNSSQLGGTTAAGGANTRSGQIFADTTNGCARMLLTPGDTTSRTQAFTFVYQVA